MAMRNLEVIVTVTDKASKPLDDISKKVRGTGKAAAQSEVDFTKFNRTLFTTAAFVGTFTKMFSTLTNAFDQGSELDRLSNQFERVLGPKGNLFNVISQMTDASIDKFEAMRQGISLRSLGIVKSTEHLADIVSKAGVAAKMAGHDSGEGIKNYSEFLKDGNVSHLQFLNLIAQTNPALQAQMAILSKAGGVMGGVVSTQARLALGQSLLNAAVRGNLKGFGDLRDIMLDAKTNFSLFRQEAGRLLLTALAPLVDKFSQFMLKLSMTIDNIRKNDKNLVFLIKTVVIATGAVLGLAGALGTLRLATMALTSIGFGLPRLMFLITLLSTGFLGITGRVEKFTDKLKVFGAFVKGVYQLVTSLNTKTGIAQIDEDIKALLEKNGIFTFAQNVARAISVVKTVIGDMIDAFKWAAKTMDNLFGGIGRKFIDMISKFKQPWANFWVNESATPVEKFVRNFAVLGGTLGTVFTGMVIRSIMSKLSGSVLSKIPLIGGLFGSGRGGGPKGSKSDPIYTKAADSVGSGLMSMIGFGAGGKLKGIFDLFMQTFAQGGLIKALKDIPTLFGLFTESFGGAVGIFRTVASFLRNLATPILVFGAAILGIGEGLWNSAADWKALFVGIYDMGRAITDIAINFVKNNKVLNFIFTTLGKLAEGIFTVGKFILVDGPMKLLGMIRDGWRLIAELFGSLAGKLGINLSSWARELSPDTFKTPMMPDMPTQQVADGTDAGNTAGESGEKTASVNIPQDTTANIDTMDVLGEALKTVSGSQRKQMQMSIENALRSDSAGGSAITAEEMAEIMKFSKDKEVDILTKIESNTRKTAIPTSSSRRGI